MNKKISLGAAITLMAIVAAVTFSITMVFSMGMFNDRMFNIKERESMYTKLSEVDRIYRQNYVGEIDEDRLNDYIALGYVTGTGDIRGTYMTAATYNQLVEQYEGKTVGIGADVMQDVTGYIKVVLVYPDSPAESQGLQKNDLIIKVDDLDVTVDNYSQAVNALRGDAGTSVKLVVRRGSEDIEMEVTRREIVVQSVQYREIGTNGYIKITDFNSQTPEQFRTAVNTLVNSGVETLIFDLRENLGGQVNAAGEMLDLLLPEGDVVTATYQGGREEVIITSDAGEVDLPMVVLVNGNTASAAELFASALRDFDKARLVGTQTYGKGTMQETFRLNDGSALQISVAYFETPKTENFDGVGLKPDYEVTLTTEQEQSFYDLDEETDPQLQKAIEVVQSSKQVRQNTASVTDAAV